MLTRVEVRNDHGNLLNLSLQEILGGFIVEEIQGLDPVAATIVSSSFAQLDGEQYQSSRREKRNLVMRLALEPGVDEASSVQAMRSTLYKYFMPKQKVRLRFFSIGFPTVDIEGRIESFDAPQFVQEPTATISILCLDPDFKSQYLIYQSGNTVGSVAETTLNYAGSVETGFLFKLNVNRPISEFTIYHRPASDSLRVMEFQTAEPLRAGDVISISTQPGDKYATLTRAGIVTSVLYCVSSQASWSNLFPGPNKLRIFAEGAGIPYTIEYYTKFGGL